MPTDACRVLMIYPRFLAASFWSLQETCKLTGVKYPVSPLGLITVAAMLPASWDIRLIDRNARDVEESDYEWADMVMTGGMLPQQTDCLSIIEEAQLRGLPTVVGGPDITSSPHIYEKSDFRVLGEAEGIIDEFVAAWSSGDRAGTFESPKFQVDVTESPTPRFDLLDFGNYFHIGLQFSRGCPFMCEFCDIIELYGRVPRTKNTDQVLAELDTLYNLGYRGNVDFVDDNLIGNKKAVLAFLPDLIAWQKRHSFPFEFTTEASLNLADDDRLLDAMRESGFVAVFIGIESPDPAVLADTQKKQNTRRDIAESIHHIYQAGMFVWAGFIVGFDSESGSIADPMIDLIEEAAIPVCMVGLLTALPNTQLTRRLKSEGRLPDNYDKYDENQEGTDQCVAGLNFETVRPKREVLDDYMRVVRHVYAPESYFRRVRKVGQLLDLSRPVGGFCLAKVLKELKHLRDLAWGVTFHRPDYRRYFWSAIFQCLRDNPRAIGHAVFMLALYAHLGRFSQFVIAEIEAQIKAIDAEEAAAPIATRQREASPSDIGALEAEPVLSPGAAE